MTAIFPKFLEGPVREEEPRREHYMDANPKPSDSASSVEEQPYLEKDREKKNELYYIHTMEYEATQLRKIYEAKLKTLWPGWPLDESYSEIDLFQAIWLCDGIWVKQVEKWVDRVGKGEKIRFGQE